MNAASAGFSAEQPFLILGACSRPHGVSKVKAELFSGCIYLQPHFRLRSSAFMLNILPSYELEIEHDHIVARGQETLAMLI